MKLKLLFCLLCLSALSYAQIPTTDLLKSYSFSNGTLVNQATPGVDDLIATGTSRTLTTDFLDTVDEAFVLNGDAFNAGDRDDGSQVTGREDVSISFWIKTGTVNSTPQNIIQQYGNSGFGAYGWFTELVDGKIRLSSNFLKNGNSTTPLRVIESSSIVADNNWHHVAIVLERVQFTFNGSAAYGLRRTIFIDGVEEDTLQDGGASSVFFVYVNPALETIKIAEGSNKYLEALDNVRIYNAALTTTDIANLNGEFYISVPRLFVNQNATGNKNGLTWSNAFTDIHKALTLADSGTEVWISGGVYKPSVANRSEYFTVIKENLSLYGGFSGTETQLSDRIIGANETILSGDLQGNDVNATDFISNYANTTRGSDNSYHIIEITETGNNLLLDNLTISDAHNNLSATERGGAIIKDKTVSKLSFKNCTVINNVSRNDNSGILAEFDLNNTTGSAGELIIENCKFISNMSRWGTCLYSFLRNDTKVDITIANSLFEGNVAGDLNTSNRGLSGSAMWLRNIGNSNSELDAKLVNNTFVNSFDSSTGQALHTSLRRAVVALNKSNSGVGSTTAKVANCIFWDNRNSDASIIKSLTSTYLTAPNTLDVLNSIDEENFTHSSISSTTSTSNADPLFTSTTDFTLQNGSPAIDSGDNTSVIGTTDLLGNQRIFNTTVDMGGFEFASTLTNQDFSFNKHEVKLYPNPTSGSLYIKMKQGLKSATIYSILGKEVMTFNSNSANVSALNSGVYIIKIEDVSGTISTKRFIKN